MAFFHWQLYQKALKAFNDSDFIECEYILTNSFELSQLSLDAVRLLAAVKLRLEKYIDAISLIDNRYLANDPDFILSSIQIKSLLLSNDFERASSCLSALLTLPNIDINLLLDIGVLFFDCRLPAQAIICFRRVLDIDATSLSAALKLTSSLISTQCFDEALDVINASLIFYPSCSDLYINLGSLYHSLHQYSKSASAFSQATRLNPRNSHAYSCLGLSYFLQGNLQAASQAFQSSLSIDHQSQRSLYYLSLIKTKYGLYLEAISLLRSLLSFQPSYLKALKQLGLLLSRIENYNDAADVLLHCYSIEPTDPDINSTLGLCLLHSRPISFVRDFYRKAYLNDPSNTLFSFYLFLSYAQSPPHYISSKDPTPYLDNFLDSLFLRLGRSNIYAFGDSHVLLFSGLPRFEVLHVGASTAFNLLSTDSSTGGRNQILNKLAGLSPQSSAILLCFGEVDTRSHILRYCYQKNISIEQSVSEVLDRYMQFSNEIKSLGFDVIIFGGFGAGENHFSVGTSQDRNLACSYLHSSLVSICRENDIFYFSLHDSFFDFDYLSTDLTFTSDGFHLLNSSQEVQLLLINSLFKSIKSLRPLPASNITSHILAFDCNASVSQFATLDNNGLLSHQLYISTTSILIDLSSFVPFKSLQITLTEMPSVGFINLFADGHPIIFEQSTLSDCCILLSVSSPLVCRYLSLHSTSCFFSKIKSLVFDIQPTTS